MYSLAAAPDFPSLRRGVDLFLSNFLGIETNFLKYIYVYTHVKYVYFGGGSIYAPVGVPLFCQESHLLLCVFGQIPDNLVSCCKGAFPGVN